MSDIEKLKKLKKLKQIMELADDPTGKLLELTEKVETDEIENANDHQDIRDDIEIKIEEVAQAVEDIELLEAKQGGQGERGEQGIKGDKGDAGSDGKDGLDGIDGLDGEQGLDGEIGAPGEPGDMGEDGKMGPRPEHEWKGTKLRFEKRDGKWGRWKDLRGKSGGGAFLQGSTGKMIEVQSDGAIITQSLKSVNFAEGLKVTDNGLGYITVDADGSEIPFYWSRDTVNGYIYPKTLTDDVGIGTNSPAAPLDVGGHTDTSHGGGAVAFVTADYNGIKALTMNNVNAGSSTDMRFLMNDGTGHYLAFAQPGINNTAELFNVAKNTADFLFNNAGTTRDLVIGTVSAKSLILGTANNTRLTVDSAGDISTTEDFAVGKNLSTGGNISIGSAAAGGTPGKALDIKGHLAFTSVVAPSSACTYTLSGTAGNVDDGVHRYKVSYYSAKGETSLSASYVEATVVDKSTSGQVLLDDIPVSPDPTVTGRRIYRGKAGVSTSNYYLLVEIADNTTTTYTDNIADGSLPAGDYRNISNTTSANTYKDGSRVMSLGEYNASVGLGSLNPTGNPTGYFNFALGLYALGAITTGGVNTAVGSYACNSLTGASSSVAVGSYSLYSVSTGYDNVGVGVSALRTAATGRQNVAVGSSALYTQGSSYSVGLGYQAGYKVSATGVVAIGRQSLYDGTSATGMVSIGYMAGYSPAGVTANKSTTSTYGTFIGYQSGLGSTTQRVGAIAIGYKAVVDAAYTCVIGGAGAQAVDLIVTKNATIGNGAAGVDYTLTFDGETNDGVITWMEDEDYFRLEDDVVFNTGAGLPYGQIYEEDGSGTVALAAQDTYYQVANFTVDGESNLTTPDYTNDHITVSETGKYLASINIGFSQTTAVAIEYDFHVQTNNGANDFPCTSAHRNSGGASQVGSTSSSGIISLTAGDTVEVWVKRLTGAAVSRTITIVNASLTLTQIGG